MVAQPKATGETMAQRLAREDREIAAENERKRLEQETQVVTTITPEEVSAESTNHEEIVSNIPPVAQHTETIQPKLTERSTKNESRHIQKHTSSPVTERSTPTSSPIRRKLNIQIDGQLIKAAQHLAIDLETHDYLVWERAMKFYLAHRSEEK